MLEIQTRYIEFLQQLQEEIRHIELGALDSSVDSGQDFGIDHAIETIKSTELLVPVIGAFSAGKSSLLNSLLNEQLLRVAITPETALATELRFDTDERIDAVKENGEILRFALHDSAQIAQRAAEFKFLRFYINKPVLQEIAPLILVDMPGFESPLDSHNKAIFEYIKKGVRFIVLQSVEDGNITRSMLRELENIQNLGRDFSFFLSKVNLKSPSELQAIKDLIAEQLLEHFDYTDEIVGVDNNGGESLKRIIRAIDPSKLIQSLYEEDLKEQFHRIKQTINTKIAALSRSKEENQNDIQALKQSIAKLERDRDSLIADVQNRYGSNSVNTIVNALGHALTNSSDEIIQSYMSGGEGGMATTINEIAKNTITAQVRLSMENIQADIVGSFASSLADIEQRLQSLSMSENLTEMAAHSITANSSAISSGAVGLFTKGAEILLNKGGILGRIGSIMTWSIPVVGPIVSAVLLFLPEILRIFGGRSKEEATREKIREALITQIVPQAQGKIRQELPPILNSQISSMIEEISANYKEQIDQNLLALESAQQEIDAKKADIDSAIARYKQALDRIVALASSALYR